MTSPPKPNLIYSIIHALVHFLDRAVLHSSRRTRVFTFSAIFLTVCAFGAAGVAPLAPDAADLPVKQITEQLPIPGLDEQIRALQEGHGTYVYEEKVRRGDTLASLLQRLGVDDPAANKFIKSNAVARLVMQQRPGKSVRVQTNEEGELLWLQTHLVEPIKDVSQLKNLTITRQANGTELFGVVESKVPLERRIEMKSGEIASSLFAATDDAQIPDAIANQLVEMFSTNIDFNSDLRRGDHFQLMYETFWQNGEMVRTGKVLAGEFTNAGRSYQNVWFDDAKEGGGGYYSFDGKSMKKAFLKSPIAFTRISSGFAMRVHPLSGKWKQHKGVDFAAPTGTPIHASADGVVESAGKSNGYGNLVVLKHWNSYTTAYAHMSRFAADVKKGSKVKQGDVIGYVGSTGWATGPHLHYELRANNKAQDPMKVKIDQSKTLVAADLARFNTVVQDVQHRFSLLRPNDIPQAVSKMTSQVAIR